MAIILQHLPTGDEYIFLGVGGGEGKPLLPTHLLGDLFSSEEPERGRSATVCDARGRILRFPLDQLLVVEVDGQKPDELLPESASPPPPDPEKALEISGTEGNHDEFTDEEDWI